MGSTFFGDLERYRTGHSGNEHEFELPLPKSPRGMTLRECPETGCRPRLFMLGDAPDGQIVADEHCSLVRRAPHTAGTTCPYCGTDAHDVAFRAEADVRALRQYAIASFKKGVSDALLAPFREVARATPVRSGISLEVRTRSDVRQPRYPYRADLLRNLACSLCGRAYGVYAIALFCPDCGGRNVGVHFRREVELVERQLALAESQWRVDEELGFRLLGNAHEDVLTAHETFLKTVYRFLVRRRFPDPSRRLRGLKSTFQSVSRSQERYAAMGIDPYAVLTPEQFTSLERHVRTRHILGHNLGMTDEEYLGDHALERIGETVRLGATEVRQFAELCRLVIDHLECSVPEFLPQAATANTPSNTM